MSSSLFPISESQTSNNVCPEIQSLSESSKRQQRINDLIKKYHILNNLYEMNREVFGGPPQLLDAVSTGYGRQPHTFRKYSSEIGEDIKDILTLIPETKFCNQGEARVRDGMSPLAMACHNPGIPLDIIKFLIDNGCDPMSELNVNGAPTKIIKSLGRPYLETMLEKNLSPQERANYQMALDRLIAIEKIFEECSKTQIRSAPEKQNDKMTYEHKYD